MRSFTLDTNCVIAVEDHRPAESAVRRLAEAHLTGQAVVAVVAIAASETGRSSGEMVGIDAFQQRLERLGLGHLEILAPLAYWDITFWDHCIWADDGPMEALEKDIHDVLFPTVEFEWDRYCRARGLDPSATSDTRWRNAKCDVQSMWTHVFNKRDVFVTSDLNFHAATKRPALVGLGAGQIELPDDAVSLL